MEEENKGAETGSQKMAHCAGNPTAMVHKWDESQTGGGSGGYITGVQLICDRCGAYRDRYGGRGKMFGDGNNRAGRGYWSDIIQSDRTKNFISDHAKAKDGGCMCCVCQHTTIRAHCRCTADDDCPHFQCDWCQINLCEHGTPKFEDGCGECAFEPEYMS
jgi:hypothetical protein